MSCPTFAEKLFQARGWNFDDLGDIIVKLS